MRKTSALGCYQSNRSWYRHGAIACRMQATGRSRPRSQVCEGCRTRRGIRERAHRLAAVADGGFLVVRHFAERPAVRRIPERSGRSRSRSARQVSLASNPSTVAVVSNSDVAAVRDRERAHESRRAIDGCAFAHAPIDIGEALVVGGIFAQISRRVNAGLAVQRVHFEARVFGHRQHAGDAGVVQRFLPRVLGERRPGLLGDARCPGKSASVFSAIGSPSRMRTISRSLPAFVVAIRMLVHPRVPRSPRCPISECVRRPASAGRSGCRSLFAPGRAARPARRGRRAALRPCPCTSMNLPLPVMTTFMSTSARESSSYARSSMRVLSMMPTLVAAT